MKYTYFRYLMVAPFTLIALASFALYFGVRNAGYCREGWQKYAWAATAGVLTAVTNPLYNVIFLSFVFWRGPVWRNNEGQFSPFTTTRLKAYREEGTNFVIEHLIAAVDACDPEHFR